MSKANKSTAQNWSLRALSVELNVDRTVLARKLKGLEPTGKEGRFNTYYMADVVAHLYAADKLDPAQESAKLNKSRREKIDLEKAELEGELVGIEEVAEIWTDVCTNVKTKMLAIPNGVSRELMACASLAEMQTELTKAIKAALVDLADTTRKPIKKGRK
jgi:phage terminase Nu1 subunit (DNA packaging protein)